MNIANSTITKLTMLTDNDWKIALEKCKRLIDHRTCGRTNFGCHSEQNLGESPFDYYVKEAIDKLYNGDWEWKDKHSFPEQMCRIVGSLMSEQVRKYKNEQKKNPNTTKKIALEDIDFYFYIDSDEDIEILEREKKYEQKLDVIQKAIDGKDDMETLLCFIMDGKTNDEICTETGWNRKKLYKVTDQLKSQTREYIANNTKKPQNE